jgi:hypothetical protein
MATVCRCHQVPRVFKGGHWRCAVKFSAAQHRYEISDKGRRRKHRYHHSRDHYRVYVGAHRLRMPTYAHKLAAHALIARKLNEFKQKQAAEALED